MDENVIKECMKFAIDKAKYIKNRRREIPLEVSYNHYLDKLKVQDVITSGLTYHLLFHPYDL